MSQELAQQVKQAALAAGFDFAAIAPYEPPPNADRLPDWLGDGHAGTMQWLERNVDRRMDPRIQWPDGHSILTVGLAYNHAVQPDAPDPRDPSRGRFARYAWGLDYHDLMTPRLNELLKEIENLAGRQVQGKAYVDTGPILERPITASAGLGFIGKHTLFIRWQYGSWYFLGELLLDLELPPDPPKPVLFGCRGCHRCGEICPTGALDIPFVNQAERCISYLTIEHRGPLPKELRPKMGNWVFGCDLCQEVCPYNARETQLTKEEWFTPRIPDFGAPKLLDLFALDDEDFRELFRGSAVKRTKRRGLLSNVAVALGNWGSDETIPALANALSNEPEPLIRGHAAWSLGRLIENTKARTVLDDVRTKEDDTYVLMEIEDALAGNV